MRIVAVAAIATTLTGVGLITTAEGDPATAQSCTVTTQQFSKFSTQVWSEQLWKRGRPKASTIAAMQHKLSCAAGPGHRDQMLKIWQRDKEWYNDHRHHCYSGVVFAGRVSTFSGGLTAGGYSAYEPGFAVRDYSTLGKMFWVKTKYGAHYLRHTDYGPAPWTGRALDITEASVSMLGGRVETDSWGSARLIPSNCIT